MGIEFNDRASAKHVQGPGLVPQHGGKKKKKEKNKISCQKFRSMLWKVDSITFSRSSSQRHLVEKQLRRT